MPYKMNHLLKLTLVFVALLAGTGCNPYQMAAENITEQYDAELRPKLNIWTRKDVLSRFGIPTSKMTLEGIEVWEYRFEAGMRANAYVAFNTYDKFRFEFSPEGVMQKYQINVTR